MEAGRSRDLLLPYSSVVWAKRVWENDGDSRTEKKMVEKEKRKWENEANELKQSRACALACKWLGRRVGSAQNSNERLTMFPQRNPVVPCSFPFGFSPLRVLVYIYLCMFIYIYVYIDFSVSVGVCIVQWSLDSELGCFPHRWIYQNIHICMCTVRSAIHSCYNINSRKSSIPSEIFRMIPVS